jgi:hypothetical protein
MHRRTGITARRNQPDTGLTHGMIDDVSRAGQARDLTQLRDNAETIFPPHYDPSLTKLAHHIEV